MHIHPLFGACGHGLGTILIIRVVVKSNITARYLTYRNFDKMQVIFKVITGSSGPAPWWEGKCGTVWTREKSVAKNTELVAALGSSLC